MSGAVDYKYCGRYELGERLGAGGMGVVYRGRDPKVNRPVAIKLMRADMPEDVRQRFLREATLTAKVRHPHIIEVYDVGETEQGEPFLVMELLQGKLLAELIAETGKMALERVLRLADQLCDALHEAHRQGMVHRDIKPDNIFIERPGAREVAKVLDFGIAKAAMENTRLTADGQAIGTPEYMAPEQIAGEFIDGRVDQYALAGVLFRAISGRALFKKESIVQLLNDHINTEPKLITEFISVPAHVSGSIHRALSKSPRDRFPTMRDFADALHGKVELAPTLGNVDDIVSVSKSLEEAMVSGLVREADGVFSLISDADDKLELDTPVPVRDGPVPAKMGLRPESTPQESNDVALARPVETQPKKSSGALQGAMAIADSVGATVWKRLAAYPLLAIVLCQVFSLGWGTGILAGLAGVSFVSFVGLLLTSAK